MGIPNYFREVVQNYRNILQIYKSNSIKIDNLYLDANSIIYDSVKRLTDQKIKITNQLVLQETLKKIKSYILEIKPIKSVFVAFDGVAPAAKLKQQKSRRYKSYIEKELKTNNLNKLNFNETDIYDKRDTGWSTICITPGTEFMNKLSRYMYKNLNNPSEFNLQELIVSGPDEYGEGEHKIYTKIRENKKYHLSTTTVIYGLDADLLMLSLLHLQYTKYLYLYRETPEFIKSIDSTLKPDCGYVLDIVKMGNTIVKDISRKIGYKKDIDIYKNKTNLLRDYVTLCFFLGNDFLPHFPALDIRNDGMTYLFQAFADTIRHFKTITSNDRINWKSIKHFVKVLSKLEEKQFVMRLKKTNNLSKKIKQQLGVHTTEYILNNIPVLDNRIEMYVNPNENGWETRYYNRLFNSEPTDITKSQISENYLQGIEWTFNYYNGLDTNWDWMYKYQYPPLLVDLFNYIPHYNKKFIEPQNTNPVSPYVQLSYVLPSRYFYLLPERITKELKDNYPELYNETSNAVCWAYCRYFWESHVDYDVDLNKIKNIIKQLCFY